jgi:tight adherence protein B
MRQRGRRRELTGWIERYGRRRPAASASEAHGKLATAAIGAMGRLLESSNSEPKLARRLDLAGISRKPAEVALLGVCAGAVITALLTLLSSLVTGVLGGALLGYLTMRLILTVLIGRRRAAFSEQLPDVLQLVAGSLQSGFSLPQALDTVVREGSQPAAGEFGRALAEARIGLDLDVALDGVAERMNSTDFRWTVMAIRIQREVGGNLVEVLRNTVATMRERASFRRHVRALTSEGRLSAYILGVLPLAIGGWLLATDRGYLRPLYTTGFGLFMLFGAAVLFVAGVAWMRGLIKVEV